jgi:hypothetical protein
MWGADLEQRRTRNGRGGARPGAGAKPSAAPRRVQRGLRWDPALLAEFDAWASQVGLTFTAAVHVAARRILSRRCELLGPHSGAVRAHIVDGEVLLLCEQHAPEPRAHISCVTDDTETP